MQNFAGWLTTLFQKSLEWLYNIFIDCLQSISDTLADFIVSIVQLFPAGSVLPTNVAAPVSATYSSFITTLNWIFPISYLSQLTGWLIAAIIAYAVIAPLARWAKLLT